MTINVWQGKSGVHWNNKTGCSVGPELEEIWAAHITLIVCSMIVQQLLLTINLYDT